MINRRKPGGAFALEARKCPATLTREGVRKDYLGGGVSGPYAGRNLLGSPGPIGWHVTRALFVKTLRAFCSGKLGALNNPLIPLEGCRRILGFLRKLADRAKSGLRPLFAGALESVSP